MSQRKTYTPKFKQQAASLVLDQSALPVILLDTKLG